MRLRVSSSLVAASMMGVAALPAAADVTISNHATMHMNCSGGVCSPTAATAVLNVGDLQALLASSSVTVTSDAAAPDIHVASALTWASSSTLSLDSHHAISIEKPVSVTGTGGLSLATNDGGTGGDYTFTGMARVIFWDLSSSLTINAHGYALVGDIATLASDVASDPAGNYALANDYNAKPDGTYPSAPVAAEFFGTFEGLGNTITNLRIRYNAPGGANIGLFAFNGSGTLRDINLTRANVSGHRIGGGSGGPVVGMLVGFNAGTILRASAEGAVLARGVEGVAGGLVGAGEGIISDSSAGGTVNGGEVAGGLIGNSDGTTITRAFATGSVAGGAYGGGLAGIAENGSITLSHATGSVTSIAGNLGGLVGWASDNPIAQSYATGAVNSTTSGNLGRYAGLVGLDDDSAIAQCYALGSVTAASNSFVGGLVGVNRYTHAPSITQSYSAGAVSDGGSQVLMGGLIGFDKTMTATFSYWDLDTSGIGDPSRGAGKPANDPGITGLTTAQLQSGLPGGFDSSVWGSDPGINGGLPYLLAAPPP